MTKNMHFELLDKGQTYSLRGLCMLMIIIHHIVLVYGGPAYLRFTTPWGYLGTGVFFFLSGYGLFCSLKKKDTIPNTWIYTKVKKMILPFIFAFAIYIICALLFERSEVSNTLIEDLCKLRIPHTTSWFLKAILGIYITVFAVFKQNADLHIKVFALSSLVCLFFIIAYFTLSAEWHWTILNFPLGMICGLYYFKLRLIAPPITTFIRFLAYVFLLTIIFIAVSRMGLSTISSLVFTLICIVVIQKVNVSNNIFDYIGKQSINFYIFQMVFLHYGLIFCSSWYVYFAFVMISTYLLSRVYDFLSIKIDK